VLLAIGLVHAALLWSGDVLLVYAAIGFLLLALRRAPDPVVLVLIGLCLLWPALSDGFRSLTLSISTQATAAFEYEEFEASNNAAFGQGSFLEAVRETMRVFAWFWASPLGLLSLADFAVQMATGILLGFMVGRRRWVEKLAELRQPLQRLQLASLAVALGCGGLWPVVGPLGGADEVPRFAPALLRTLGRAALMAFYAASILRLLDRPSAARFLRPFALAGRMPLSNYLLQTVLATFVFYGWGLGFWGRASPWKEVALAAGLFFLVQLPLSAWWLAHFRYGPVEYVWRRLTYGRLGDRA